jgi:hypothetical protein
MSGVSELDLGDPISYLVLEPGAPVYAADGERIGTVEHVLSVPDDDIFDGLVVETPNGRRFVDAPYVEEIHERGVVLTLTAAEADALPEPAPHPPMLEAGPEDVVPDDLRDKLRRAWQLISGDY